MYVMYVCVFQVSVFDILYSPFLTYFLFKKDELYEFLLYSLFLYSFSKGTYIQLFNHFFHFLPTALSRLV